MAVEILIKKIILDGGNVRFDLMGKNLPENFLGMASDLKFADGGGDIKYEKMEWGNAFTGFAPENLPVKMVKNDWEAGKNEGTIIFGISLKADNLKNLHDGVIGSFYFSGKGNADLQFTGFQHEILSTYENGRVDLTDVKWLDAGQIKMPTEIISAGPVQIIEIAKTPVAKENVKSQAVKNVQNDAVIEATARTSATMSTQNSTQIPTLITTPTIYPNDMSNPDEVAQSDLTPATPTDLRSMDMPEKNELMALSDSQFFWWFGPCLIGLIVLLLISFFYLRRRPGNRTWQYSRV